MMFDVSKSIKKSDSKKVNMFLYCHFLFDNVRHIKTLYHYNFGISTQMFP